MKQIRTKSDRDFILKIMSVFEGFGYKGKKYLSYIETRSRGDEFLIRDNIVKPFFTDVLGYDKQKDFAPEENIETGKPDIQIIAPTGNPVVVIETLSSGADNRQFEEHRKRLFDYMDELGSKIAILTNGIVFNVYENKGRDKAKNRLVLLKFDEIYKKIVLKGLDGFDSVDWERLLGLKFFVKELVIVNTEQLSKEPELDISEKTHFSRFLEQLINSMEQVKMDVKNQFEIYLSKNEEYEQLRKNREENGRPIYQSESRQYELPRRCVQSFKKWHSISSANCEPETFQLETMYIFFNRILLLRICEDKDIIKKRRISNGGITDWITYKEYTHFSEVNYNELIKDAYKVMEKTYPHLFREDIFDWYMPNNDVLWSVLYAFNFYNFRQVDRDILGKLYERYIPREERKKLGQFYTPEEVINYILDAVGYREDADIEGKRLLDPACGSGGFLVRATNILVQRLKARGFEAETILNKVRESIYGFEINPFASHLAETNLLFQVIDLIKEAKKENPEFEMGKFNVFETDSLRIPKQEKPKLFKEYNSEWFEDAETVRQIKLKEGRFKDGFDFVVGNPPYGIIFDKKEKNSLKVTYPVLSRNYDLYTAFIQCALNLCNQQGLFGFIVPNTYIHGPYFEKLREFILSGACIKEMVDFVPFQVFDDPNVFNSILVLEKNIRPKENNIFYHRRLKYSPKLYDKTNLETTKVTQGSLSTTTWRISGPLESRIKEGSYCIDTICEIKDVGLNYWTVGRGKRRGGSIADRILYRGKQECSLDIPFLKGRDIDKYLSCFSNNWLRYNYKELLNPDDVFRFSPGYFTLPEKIVYRQTSDTIKAAFDTNQYYVDKTVHIVVLRKKHSQEFNLKYILALLNSTLFAYLYNKIVHEKGRVFAQLKTFNIKQLSVKAISLKTQQKFADLVDQILEINKVLPDYVVKVSNIQKLLEDFDTSLGDLADISGIRLEIKERIGKPKIRREELKVYLDRKSYIECENDALAEYIELYLNSLSNTLRGKTKPELVKLIQIPKSLTQVKAVLDKRNQLLKKIETLTQRRDELDKEIDRRVYKLYGLSAEEIKVVDAIKS